MWTPLGNPVPRKEPRAYTPWRWPITRSIKLPSVRAGTSPWLDALEVRRSRRTFAPPTLDQLGMLLWHALRCQRRADSPLGFELQQRPIPSAGAIHPIHLVIQLPGDPHAWARYNPLTHALDLIGPPAEVLGALHAQAEHVMPMRPGSLLLFIAEPAMTAAKYENAESLVWRDAGVMQGVLAVTAEALHLHYCLLGITGDPWVGTLCHQGQLLVGVGVAALGACP